MRGHGIGAELGAGQLRLDILADAQQRGISGDAAIGGAAFELAAQTGRDQCDRAVDGGLAFVHAHAGGKFEQGAQVPRQQRRERAVVRQHQAMQILHLRQARVEHRSRDDQRDGFERRGAGFQCLRQIEHAEIASFDLDRMRPCDAVIAARHIGLQNDVIDAAACDRLGRPSETLAAGTRRAEQDRAERIGQDVGVKGRDLASGEFVDVEERRGGLAPCRDIGLGVHLAGREAVARQQR